MTGGSEVISPVVVAAVLDSVVMSAVDSNADLDGSLAVVALGLVEDIPVAAGEAGDMATASCHLVDWDAGPPTSEATAKGAERHVQCKEEVRDSRAVDEVEDWHHRYNSSGPPYCKRFR